MLTCPCPHQWWRSFSVDSALLTMQGIPAIAGRVGKMTCWLCGAAVVPLHCKIICGNCGFTRDCSDPVA